MSAAIIEIVIFVRCLYITVTECSYFVCEKDICSILIILLKFRSICIKYLSIAMSHKFQFIIFPQCVFIALIFIQQDTTIVCMLNEYHLNSKNEVLV